MTVTNNIVLTGNQNNALMEVESASKAARMTFRPIDYNGVQGGIYSVQVPIPDNTQGTNVSLSAAAGTFNKMMGFRWVSKFSTCRLKKLQLNISGGTGAFNNIFICRATKVSDYSFQYNSADSGGTVGANSVNVFNPHNSRMALKTQIPVLNSLANMADIVTINGNGTQLTALAQGPVLETQPFAAITTAQKTTTANPMFNDNMQNTGHPVTMWDAAWGDAPIEFSENTGFVTDYCTNSGSFGGKVMFILHFEEIALPMHRELQ